MGVKKTTKNAWGIDEIERALQRMILIHQPFGYGPSMFPLHHSTRVFLSEARSYNS